MVWISITNGQWSFAVFSVVSSNIYTVIILCTVKLRTSHSWLNFSDADQPDIIWNVFIYSLWLSDALWWCRSGSTLAQVMAWCRQATSHYLNQCWLIISEILLHLPEQCYTQGMFKLSIQYIGLKITNLKLQPHIPGAKPINCGELFDRWAVVTMF